ncbi:MAG TPA: glycosyltransferase family 2 protein [Bacillota bacterium]|nr:glycosyltransferase family 2 protein [Bacillota bacterium]
MKYAILIPGNQNKETADDESARFYQWLKVFGGQVIQGEDGLNSFQDGVYDLIHIRLTGANLDLIHQVRERLGQNSRTKVVLSLDIPVQYWPREFEQPNRLQQAIRGADFVFGAEYSIARALEEKVGRKVYEIPYPVNPGEMKSNPNGVPDQGITILGGRGVNLKKYLIPLHFFQPDLKIQVLAVGDGNTADVRYCRRKNIDFVSCATKDELYEKLGESQFLLIPKNYPVRRDIYDEQNLVVKAAFQGTILLGAKPVEAMRRCYPEITGAPIHNSLLLYWRLKNNPAKINFLRETAKVKAEYYHPDTLQKRLPDFLYRETRDPRFCVQVPKSEQPLNFHQIHHVHGETTVNYHHEEFVVVCLVKNGAEYIKAFMEHYQRLGARHFFFIDNGSTDQTIGLLKSYQSVTIFETQLPHKQYECEIRRAVIEKHCRDNWALCVDIDELFDYPYSDRISMGLFLRYLNSNKYTAVLSYLLDMFSKEFTLTAEDPERTPDYPERTPDYPEREPEDREKDLVNTYCYYDLSNIRKIPYYKSFTAYSNYNRLADPQMKNYSGGIRGTFFKTKESGYLLTKHPLIFVDSKIEPVVHPHFCNKAFVADVNGVVKHYKFIGAFKDKVIQSLEAQNFSYYAEREYQEYLKAIKDQPKLSFYSPKARKLEQVEQLVDGGFLRVSKSYQDYVKSMSKPAEIMNTKGESPDEP